MAFQTFEATGAKKPARSRKKRPRRQQRQQIRYDKKIGSLDGEIITRKSLENPKAASIRVNVFLNFCDSVAGEKYGA